MNEWPVRAGGMDHGTAKGTKHSRSINGALLRAGRSETASTPSQALQECVALHWRFDSRSERSPHQRRSSGMQDEQAGYPRDGGCFPTSDTSLQAMRSRCAGGYSSASSEATIPSAVQSSSPCPRAMPVISLSRTTPTDGIGAPAISASASARRTSLSASGIVSPGL